MITKSMGYSENSPPSSLIDLNKKGTFDLSRQNNTGGFGGFPIESSGRSQKYATFPRKILAEKNGSSMSDSPNTAVRMKSPNRKHDSGYSAHCSDDCNQTNVRPYDPVTNCFTPRPRFLRYDPQRRRGCLLQAEKQMLVDDGEGFVISLNEWLGNDNFHQSSASSSSKTGKSISGAWENGVISEDEGEECNAEKDERSALRLGVLFRALLLLGTLYLSSCFILVTDTSGTLPITWEFQCPKGDYVDDHFIGHLIVGNFNKCFVGADELLSSMVEEIRGNSMLTDESGENYAVRITGDGEKRNPELVTIVERGGGGQSFSIDDVQQQTMEVDEQLETSGSGSSEDSASNGMLGRGSADDGEIGIENYELEQVETSGNRLNGDDDDCSGQNGPGVGGMLGTEERKNKLVIEETNERVGGKQTENGQGTTFEELGRDVVGSSNEDHPSPFNLLDLYFEKEYTSWILQLKYVLASLVVMGAFLFEISRFLHSKNDRSALKKTTAPPASAPIISDYVDASSSHRISNCTEISTHPPMVQLLGEYSLVGEDSYASNEKGQSSGHVKGMLLSKECVNSCAINPKDESKSLSTSTSMSTAKKSRKKHVHVGQETSNQDIMITPVRRSSRIRNQALRS